MFRWWQWVDYRVRRTGEWLLPRLANLRSVWRVLHRVRFAWLLITVACGALFLAQGQEILASSFVTLADALVFVSACTLAAASIWYCSRTLIRLMPSPSDLPTTPAADALRRHLPRILGALVLLLPGTALAFLSRTMPNRSLALFSAIVLINLAVAFYVALQLRRHVVLKGIDPAAEHVPSVAQLSAPTRYFLFVMLCLNVLVPALLMIWPMLPLHLHIAGGTITMVALALVVVVGSLLVHFSDLSGLPLLVLLLIAAALLSRCSVHHGVTTLHIDESRAPAPMALESYLARRIDPRLARCPTSGCAQPIPVVIVAAEGGGVRAAAWTALVLARIEIRLAQSTPPQRLNDSLVGISGVSGGSLGAAIFLASSDQSAEQINIIAKKFFAHDLLTPSLAGLLFVDPLVALSPYPIPATAIADRGLTFERNLERAWLAASADNAPGTFARPLAELWQGAHADRPLLLLNTTIASTGERMIQSPLSMGADFGDVFTGAVDANTCLKGLDIPLSAAVHNSARFTYVSPAGRWPEQSGRCAGLRVVDGGYFENSGTATAADLLTHLQRTYGNRIRPVLVQIRNDPLPTAQSRHGSACGFPGATTAEALTDEDRSIGEYLMPQLLDPLVALYAGRSARAVQAKAQLRRLVCSEKLWRGTYVEFALYASEYSTLPLHWTIATPTLQEIERQVDGIEANRIAMEGLLSVLREPIENAVPITDQAPQPPVVEPTGTTAVLDSLRTAVAAPSKPGREQRIEQMGRAVALSESLRTLSIAVFGGLAALLLGSSLRRPSAIGPRLIFFWIIPAWICLGASIYQSIDIGRRYVALVVARTFREDVPALINQSFSYQLDFATAGFAFAGLWLATYFLWWITCKTPHGESS